MNKAIRIIVKAANILLTILNALNMVVFVWMLDGRFLNWYMPYKNPTIWYLLYVSIGTIGQIALNCVLRRVFKKKKISNIKLLEYDIYALAILAFSIIVFIPFALYGSPTVFGNVLWKYVSI